MFSNKHALRSQALDTLRGFAILGMIFYHFLFDLYFFTSLSIDLSFWPIALLGATVRLTFICIVGISVYFSFINPESSKEKFINRILKKMFLLSLIAFSITLSSWLVFPNSFIRFGILHLISVAILLSVPLVQNPRLSLLLGLIITTFGFLLFPIKVSFPHFWWLGFINTPITDLDYFPVLPWIGVVFIGIWLGSIWQKKLQQNLSIFENNKASDFFSFLGRNALLIYIIHQPILLACLFITIQIFNFANKLN